VKGRPLYQGGGSGELPAPDEVVDPATGVVQEHLVFAEGKLIDAPEDEELVAVGVARTLLDVRVNREVCRPVVQRATILKGWQFKMMLRVQRR
jgi:hypothetical protein